MLNCRYARFWRGRWFTHRQGALFIAWTDIGSSVSTLYVAISWQATDSAVTLERNSATEFRTNMYFLDWLEGSRKQQARDFNEGITETDPRNPRRQSYQEAGGQDGLGHSVAGVHRPQFISDEVRGRTFPARVCSRSINTCSARITPPLCPNQLRLKRVRMREFS